MYEYIEREALHKKLKSELVTWKDSAKDDIEDMAGVVAVMEAIQLVDLQPAADVAPVRRGKWIFDGDQWDFRCTNCGMWQGTNTKKYKYCPNCGCKIMEV